MEKLEKFYITTPIYYVNAPPHIGHAYTTIAADVLARFYRSAGVETFFLTGTDEHGAKIADSAEKAGKSAQEFADEISAKFSFAWNTLEITNDRFIRTTEDEHQKAVQKALQKMYDKGDIYSGFYEGLYCRGCEQFKQERDLVDGKCPDHKVEPEKIKEETYLFKLSKYQEILLEKIEDDEFAIEPAERKNEILSLYRDQGLDDVSFSRKNVSWGIPLPWDESHTAYVWADAFLNYLTGLGWQGDEKVPELWPADLQLMSKDILRVHATIWPAMLLSLGLPLPKKLFIHGFFTIGGEKMSKSLGNIIDPEDWARKYGPDVVRYYLLREVPFGQDGDVSEEKLHARYDGELANGLGNLYSRLTNLIEKNLDGLIPEIVDAPRDMDDVNQLLRQLRFNEALARIWEEVAWANKYIDETKLWELPEKNSKAFMEIVSQLSAHLYEIAKKLAPFMPETAEAIRSGLSAEKIKKAKPLFPRIDSK